MAVVGIDLGTTNSLVSYFGENGATIIENVFGDRLTPSVVSIDKDGQIFVGKTAKERQIAYADDTVSVFKRSMGAKKDYRIGNKTFLPEELSAFVIRSLKEDAERYLGEEVTEAVISVPAYFSDTQRKATQRAGELAGLNVERLINEPTAAAIAYGLHQKESNTKFLVFDLGGGTFDVSILEKYKNVMEVRAVAGNNYLGGEDFTKILVEIFASKNNIDLDELNSTALSLLRKQAEVAKRQFSKTKIVEMSCKVNEEILKSNIHYDEYENACEVILNKLRQPIERALNDADIRVEEIDEIVLVGGATKLPIIRSFVSKLFRRLPDVSINPDEVVALGAAIQAAMKQRREEIKEIVLTDVCPYTLGTNIAVEKSRGYYESGHFFPIIERNTIIPVSRVKRVYPIDDNQREINLEILQGESRHCRDNIKLGELNIQIPPAPKGEEAVDVRYTYDINGILEVEVTIVSNRIKKSMIIEKNPGYMSKEEIEERLKELSKIKIHPKDKEENKYLLARGERLFEESLGDMRMFIEENLLIFEKVLDTQDERKIEEAAKKFKYLLDQIEKEREF